MQELLKILGVKMYKFQLPAQHLLYNGNKLSPMTLKK